MVNRGKSIAYFVAAAVLLVLVIWRLPVPPKKVPEDVLAHIASKRGLIVLHSPQPFDRVASPLEIRGEARGPWYFEGDFPVSLVDEDGRRIVQWYASARLDPDDPDSTWMTTEFVPFAGTLRFELPEGDVPRIGKLILHKNNPSDLRELDDALEIPVYLTGP